MTASEKATLGHQLCKNCATWAFSRWRGWCSMGTERWEEKPDLPDVPIATGAACTRCGGQATVSPDQVYYHNIHSEWNTGLPDYFCLEIQSEDPHDMRRWGRPYCDSWITKRVPLDELEEHVANGRWS